MANAGPLIHLSWIDQLDLLEQLFDEVLVPVAVQVEVLRAAPGTPGVHAILAAFGWLKVQEAADRAAVAGFEEWLDPGEAESIVLMQETGADLLLLDDRRARLAAARRGLKLTGTVGLLRLARQQGLIEAATPPLRELQRRGLWLSVQLVDEVEREES